MTYEAKVGSTLKFGDLFIKIQSCRKPPPVEKSEAAAFLQIWQQDTAEKKSAKPSSWIFSGWMFASSPSLSGMDHPVYDVWVVDCAGRDPEPIPEPTPEPVPEPTSEPASEAAPETSSDEPVTQEADEPASVTAPQPTDQTDAESTPELVPESAPAPSIAPRDDAPTAPPSPSFEGIY
jgi:hypothetical protein